MTQEQIVNTILNDQADNFFPAEPLREDTWHISDADLRRLLGIAMNLALEHLTGLPAPDRRNGREG